MAKPEILGPFFRDIANAVSTAWALSPVGRQRGKPVPLSNAQKRPYDAMQMPAPFGVVRYRYVPRYEEGAYAFAYQSGVLPIDPIGAGVVALNRMPSIPAQGNNNRRGVTASYQMGAILWNTTPQNFANVPIKGPLYTPGQLVGLFGLNAASAMVAPPPGGWTVPTG